MFCLDWLTEQADSRSKAFLSIPPSWCIGRRWVQQIGCCRIEWCRSLVQASHLCIPYHWDITWTGAMCHRVSHPRAPLINEREYGSEHVTCQTHYQLLSVIKGDDVGLGGCLLQISQQPIFSSYLWLCCSRFCGTSPCRTPVQWWQTWEWPRTRVGQSAAGESWPS